MRCFPTDPTHFLSELCALESMCVLPRASTKFFEGAATEGNGGVFFFFFFFFFLPISRWYYTHLESADRKPKLRQRECGAGPGVHLEGRSSQQASQSTPGDPRVEQREEHLQLSPYLGAIDFVAEALPGGVAQQVHGVILAGRGPGIQGPGVRVLLHREQGRGEQSLGFPVVSAMGTQDGQRNPKAFGRFVLATPAASTTAHLEVVLDEAL